MPPVTVIVRSMQRETLRETLRSVATQSYPEVDVLLINAKGGVHPEPGERCGPFPLRLVNQGGGPLGRSTAANQGLEHTTGAFVLFLDDDDLILPEHVAALTAALGAAPDTYVAAYTATLCVDEQGDPLPRTFDKPYTHARLMAGNFIPIHSVLFRSNAATRRCRFDESLKLFEDWDFWLQLAECGLFKPLPQRSALYRITAGSGFGANPRHADEAVRATHLLVSKWQQRWSPGSLYELMEACRHGFEAQDRLGAMQMRLGPEQDPAASLEERIDNLQADLRAAHHQLDALYRSSSWRLTQPLRRLATLIRRQTSSAAH